MQLQDQVEILRKQPARLNRNMDKQEQKYTTSSQFLCVLLFQGLEVIYLMVSDLNDGFVCQFLAKVSYGGGSRTINSNVEAFQKSFFSCLYVDKKAEGISPPTKIKIENRAGAKKKSNHNLSTLSKMAKHPKMGRFLARTSTKYF